MLRKTLMGIFVALLSVATGASAATLSTHGAAFVAYNAGQAVNVDYTLGGARTNLGGGQTLIASIPRNQITAGSQGFIAYGWHNGVQSTSCSLYSAFPDGSFVASKNMSGTNVSGAWSIAGIMTAAEVPNNTRVALLCSIPGSFLGQMSGVTVSP